MSPGLSPQPVVAVRGLLPRTSKDRYTDDRQCRKHHSQQCQACSHTCRGGGGGPLGPSSFLRNPSWPSWVLPRPKPLIYNSSSSSSDNSSRSDSSFVLEMCMLPHAPAAFLANSTKIALFCDARPCCHAVRNQPTPWTPGGRPMPATTDL